MTRTIVEFLCCMCGIVTLSSIVAMMNPSEILQEKFLRFMKKHRIIATIYWMMCLVGLIYALYNAGRY